MLILIITRKISVLSYRRISESSLWPACNCASRC